jgi:hypothetical protein
LGGIIVTNVLRGDSHHDKKRKGYMSKFDIMRAVAKGTMEAPPVPLDLSENPVRGTTKAKVWALGSVRVPQLKVDDRIDWFGEFEQKTGQV